MNSQAGVFYVPKTLVDVLAERLYEPSAGTGAWLLEVGRRIGIGGHDAPDLDLGCCGVMIVKHPPWRVPNQQAANHASGNQH